jgi:chlorite dismutase
MVINPFRKVSDFVDVMEQLRCSKTTKKFSTPFRKISDFVDVIEQLRCSKTTKKFSTQNKYQLKK